MSIALAVHHYGEEERDVLYACLDRLRAQGYCVPSRKDEKGAMFVLEFSDKECSKCGRVGLVPTHHRFLCLVCWAGDWLEPSVYPEGWQRMTVDKEPLLSEYTSAGEDDFNVVYNEVTYSSKNMSQEELQAILAG